MSCTTEKLNCPTCGHEVKYGYIEPVNRNDVLDEVIEHVMNVYQRNDPNDPIGLISKMDAIKVIEKLKD